MDKEKKRKSNRAWRKANPEQGREASCRYRKANPGKLREANRRWCKANPEKRREAGRRWREANPEKELERHRRYREANRDKLREANRRYCEANRDKLREANRRRREANSEKRRYVSGVSCDKEPPHRVRKTGKLAQLGGSRISTEEEESKWGPGLDAKCQTCGQRLSRVEMEPFSSDIYEICPDLHRHQMKKRGVIL